MGNKHSSTSIVCLSGQSVGLRATESGEDVELRTAQAELPEHNPLPQINEVKFKRDKLEGVAERLNSPPAYFFTVDGKPTDLKVSQYDLFTSKFVANFDNNELKVHKLTDGEEPRNRNGLDLEKIRGNADRGYYDWNMGSGTISRPPSKLPHSSSSDRKRRGK